MSKNLTRFVLLSCLGMGLAMVVSPYLVMFVAAWIGIYIGAMWWPSKHPVVWWYDLGFFALLLGLALTSTVTSVAICKILFSFGATTSVCQTLSFGRRFVLAAWVLGLAGVIFWMWHLWIVWKLRRQ